MMRLYRALVRMLAHARRRRGGKRACPRFRVETIRSGRATLEEREQ